MYEQINAGVRQGIKKAIEEGRLKDSFFPAGIQNFTYESKSYGLPNDVGPMAFWYNKELCRKAGVDPTKIMYREILSMLLKSVRPQALLRLRRVKKTSGHSISILPCS